MQASAPTPAAAGTARGRRQPAQDTSRAPDPGALSTPQRVTSGGAEKARLDRYALRDDLRTYSTIRRVRTCGNVVGGAVGLGRRRLPDGSWSDYTTGLETCANPWACRVCAEKIRRRRTNELVELCSAHLAAGGAVIPFLRTIPHHRGQRAREVFEAFKLAWTKMVQNTQAYRRFRKRWGVDGCVWAWDLTIGDAGWHWHRHGVLLIDRALSADELAELDREFFECWSQACALAGAGQPSHEANHVEQVRDAGAAAAYVFKAACETMRSDTKKGTEGGRTIWEVMGDLCETGAGLEILEEYEAVIKGQRSCYTSPGLRKRYGIEEVSDEEAVKEEAEGEDTELLVIERPRWERVRAIRGGEALLRQAMREGGCEAAEAVLKAWGIGTRGSDGRPPGEWPRGWTGEGQA